MIESPEDKRESKEESKEEEKQILLYNEIYWNNEDKNVNKKIDINIFDNDNKNVEKYILLNEENEILLCKEEEINRIISKKKNDEDIKIKELYNGQNDDSFYYLNKNYIKQKLLKNSIEFGKTFSDTSIDNNDEEEMEKLYKETQMEHPRKIIRDKIKRYPFFSWSGFFCCNRYDYISLGLGYTTYFNTIKLSIIFFLIIALINLISIKNCMNYNSIYDFKDDTLLKTTLGNTIIKYFNYSYIFCNTTEDCSNLNITLHCNNSFISDLITIRRYYNADSNFYNRFSYYSISKEFMEFIYEDAESKIVINPGLYIYGDDRKMHEYTYLIGQSWFKDTFSYDYRARNADNITDIIYYSCLDESNYDKGSYSNNEIFLVKIMIVTLVTLIILIIFYYTYKKAISRDNKEYLKNKIFINDYTLVLHNLKIVTDDYNLELNDLVSFLNKILKIYKFLITQNEEISKEINDFNIFDISISNVNDKKIKIFEKVKSLQNNIDDIINDNDSIKKKLKNKIREVYHSVHNIVENLTNNEEKIQENQNNTINKDSLEPDKLNEREKQERIEEKRIEINKNKDKIINDIILLHKEYNLKNYVDIYITFKNKLIKNFIYGIYNKNKFIRFLYYISCRMHKLQKYYYKNQWLNFNLANDNPSDIQWENCYISTWKKLGRRILGILISFILVIIITSIHSLINASREEKDTVKNFILVLVTQVIGIASCFIFHKIIIFEKFSSKSKDLSSFINKYFWLNFIINISLLLRDTYTGIFSYGESEKYFLNNRIIIMNIITSIITSQLSSLFFYFLNLIRRYSDSKCTDGRITRCIDKIKYNNIYLGPEFPFDERYSVILTNMAICLLFGSNCPIIFFFLVCFLIMTFLVDKFLIINYYKKPRFFGNFLSKKILFYFGVGIFIYLYGLFYNLSNPYLFNNELLSQNFSDNDILKIGGELGWLLSPISLIYYVHYNTFRQFSEERFLFYNFNLVLLIHFFIFVITFANPTPMIKKKLFPKNNLSSFLNISPVEIGKIYSLEDLQKYYEIKKLQLFDLIIDCDNKNKVKDDYRHLINNYMGVIKYIKHNIDKKTKGKDDIIINNDEEKISDEYIKLKDESIIKRNKINISGDISYNQSFIPKYEIYNNYNLMKNL